MTVKELILKVFSSPEWMCLFGMIFGVWVGKMSERIKK